MAVMRITVLLVKVTGKYALLHHMVQMTGQGIRRDVKVGERD